MKFAPFTTNQEIDNVVSKVLNKHGVKDEANVLYFKDQVWICVAPSCPFCDMDFGYHTLLEQHLGQKECMTS